MRSLLLGLILSTTILGCGSEKATSSEAGSAAPTAASDRHAADDQATEALQAHRAAEAKVVDAKATAEADLVTAHKATHTQLQANFDAADRRLTALKEEGARLTGAAKENATIAIAVAQAHEASVLASIAKLREATLAGWDAAKAQVEADSLAFTTSVAALDAIVP